MNETVVIGKPVDGYFRTEWSHSGRSGVEIAEFLDILSVFREELGLLKGI